MDIPPKYEDVVAQLEAERELHKLATETIGQFADENQKLHANLAAFREEFGAYEIKRTEFAHKVGELTEKSEQIIDALQQRLTVAEQLLREVSEELWQEDDSGDIFERIDAALKPAEEGEGS